MLRNILRRAIQLCGFLSLGSLLLLSTWSENAAAESTIAQFRGDLIQVPAQDLTQIQQELEYLRARDAERQAWEDSVMSRLPKTGLQTAGFMRDAESPANLGSTGCDSCGPSSCDSSCRARGCGNCRCHCGCYPCQCPPPVAPCIDCPRVSTLSPYFNVNVFGALKLDMLFNGPRPLAPGTPFYLFPDTLGGLDQNTFDIHARQSTLGAALNGPRLGSFQSGGLVMAMFYNDAVIVDQYGFLPLQAYGELRNQDWRFAAGLQFDVFGPGAPTVLPFSALGASGNAGNSFRGQLRLERFLYPTTDSQWTLQLALSEPITSTIDPEFRLLEDNGWPNVEGRVAWGLGAVEGTGLSAKRPFEVGASGLVGQIRTTELANDLVIDRVIADVWGLSSDFRWKVNDTFGFMGEFYTGQGLGTYNAGILQTINPETREAVRTTGGWMEVFVYLTPCLHNHTGYGIDDPLDRDLTTAAPGLARTRNTTFYSNLIWDLNQTFRVAFEFAWRETDYLLPAVPDNEGPGFHTQLQWAF